MQLKIKKKRKPVINVTSLIDVLFLLLIFFMVSSTFLEEPGMKLTLPEATSAEIGEKKEFTLYLTAPGDLFLNDNQVDVDSLENKIKNILPEMKDQALTLKADTDVNHGKVVKVMDKARLAGVKKLIVATSSSAEQK
ncbi:MAG: biopolymer transporter ExbD [Calditrichaeota bacterium]|nr:MAG: biopolymer transporter ExbD [Calditrichota bacterium]